jgi:hypothetical protein
MASLAWKLLHIHFQAMKQVVLVVQDKGDDYCMFRPWSWFNMRAADGDAEELALPNPFTTLYWVDSTFT